MPKPTQSGTPLNVEYRKLDVLRRYAQNARIHPQGQIDRLAASLAEYGWTNPILVDEADEIIAGHGRLSAAAVIHAAATPVRNWPDTAQVPVIVLKGLSPEQRRAYRIADNKLTELGQWDANVLGLELRGLQGEGFDLSLTGLADLELRSVNADLSSAFLVGMAQAPLDAEPSVRTPSGYVQMAFTVRPDERRAVLEVLRGQQARRGLASAAAALIAICQELPHAAH